MQMRKAAKAMAMAAVLLLCLQASQAAASVVSPRLERAITSGGAFGGPNSAGDDRWTIWVRFADKGLAGPQLDRALVAASAGLTAEARARRARADLGAGAVDQHDLPVAEAYVQAVAATGAHIRPLVQLGAGRSGRRPARFRHLLPAHRVALEAFQASQATASGY